MLDKWDFVRGLSFSDYTFVAKLNSRYLSLRIAVWKVFHPYELDRKCREGVLLLRAELEVILSLKKKIAINFRTFPGFKNFKKSFEFQKEPKTFYWQILKIPGFDFSDLLNSCDS